MKQQVRIKPEGIPYPFACESGEDEWGLFFDFAVGDVRQRMRWIEPGEFMMGSPMDEPVRTDREMQHKVILTKGYWLADTALTEALWMAVVGQPPFLLRLDPDHPKGSEKPVVNVSREDVLDFLGKINQQVPGLNLRLPLEAEWEYACRAGTETPFFFGDNITTSQVKYNGIYPYNNGPTDESYRNEVPIKPVPVKALPCNAWGLYQMHGNTWEWCEDFNGPYPAGPVTDPRGPEKSEGRVIRGGGMSSQGEQCRSAHRDCRDVNFHGYDLGFRLARSQ